MSQHDPTELGRPSGSGYVREEQHGPEMDDTQVQATGELADQLDPVEADDTEPGTGTDAP
jgi:hypothetical protein